VKIGPVDPEIALLKLKKERNSEGKNIALLASLPSGLNNLYGSTDTVFKL